MNNLKRVLSMALASVMLVGMMAVGASATNVEDFTDADEITHTEAVNTLVALNVINGKDDGSYFDPAGSLTRAEMAKLVVFVLHGGKDPVLGVKATPSFTDIKGNWAEQYIEYCASTGIIAGQGDGTFAPAGTLTGSQAAKMLLTAMGYNSDVFHLTGPDWEMNTNVEANKAGLYDELGGMDPTTTITRDEAAQLVYNAITSPLMVRSWSQDRTTGAITEVYNLAVADAVTGVGYNDLLLDKFNGVIKVGYLTGYTYDEAKNEWNYTFSSNANFGSDAIPTTNGNGIGASKSLKDGNDYTGFFGQKVKVVYNKDKSDVVYGVYAHDSAVLENGVTGKIGTIDTTANTVKICGTAYRPGYYVASGTPAVASIPVYLQNGAQDPSATALEDAKKDTKSFTFKAIDNNTDGRVDCIVKTPIYVSKITYMGAETMTIGAPANGSGEVIVNPNLDDIVIYEDAKRNDWTIVTPGAYSATGKDTYEKAEILTGTITGRREVDKKSGVEEYQIDGTWYKNGAGIQHTGGAKAINDEIEYIAVGNFFFYSKVLEAASTTKDLCMIISVDEDANITDINKSSIKAKLLFVDGSKKTVTLASVDGVDDKKSGETGEGDSDTDLYVDEATGKAVVAIGQQLFTYKENSDGEYELKSIAAPNQTTDNLAGYKGTGSTATYNNEKIGGKVLADDAKVFLFIAGSDYDGTATIATAKNDGKVYSGKELKNEFGSDDLSVSPYNTNHIAVSGAACLYENVDGFDYAKVGLMARKAKLEINSGSNYGYLVSNAWHTTESGTTYTYYKFWDGEDTVTYKEKSNKDLDAYKAGTVITYDAVDDEVAKNVSVVNATLGVVRGWDNVKKIDLDGTVAEITNDTVIMTVNTRLGDGVEGASIDSIECGAIDENLPGSNGGETPNVNNVRYVLSNSGTDKKVVFIMIDVEQKMDAAPMVTLKNTATSAQVEAALNNADKVVISGDYTVASADITVPKDKTLVITGDATLTNAVKGQGTLDAKSISAGANAQTATVKLTDATAVNTILEALDTNVKTLVLANDATGAATDATWYTAAGDETHIGTDTDTTAPAAGTWEKATVYTDNAGTTATAWLKTK